MAGNGLPAPEDLLDRLNSLYGLPKPPDRP
jgi:hypothetical protein